MFLAINFFSDFTSPVNTSSTATSPNHNGKRRKHSPVPSVSNGISPLISKFFIVSIKSSMSAPTTKGKNNCAIRANDRKPLSENSTNTTSNAASDTPKSTLPKVDVLKNILTSPSINTSFIKSMTIITANIILVTILPKTLCITCKKVLPGLSFIAINTSRISDNSIKTKINIGIHPFLPA